MSVSTRSVGPSILNLLTALIIVTAAVTPAFAQGSSAPSGGVEPGREATIVHLDVAEIGRELANGEAEIPWDGGTVTVRVDRVQVVADDATVVDAGTGDTNPLETDARSYRGHIQGEPRSSVALTVTSEALRGVVRPAEGQARWIEPIDGGPTHRIYVQEGFDHDRIGHPEPPEPPAPAGGDPAPSRSGDCGLLDIGCLLNDPPNEPSNPSPSDGATGVSISPTLSWDGGDPDGDSVTYTVYLEAGDRTPDDVVCRTTDTWCDVSLSETTTYHWKVKADDGSAQTTGDTWQFRTRDVNDPPDAPSNPSPSDGASGVSTSPTLAWDGGDPDGDTVTYTVYLDAWDTSPDRQVCQTTSTWCDVDGLAESTTYHWEVRADDGSATTQGPTWSFTTGSTNDPPYRPSNPSPSDGATGVDPDPTVSWDGGDPDGDVVTYTVHLEAGDASPDRQECQTTTTSCDVSGLDYSTTYYWEVRADDGSETTTSETWQFTTRDPDPPTTPDTPSGPSSGDRDTSYEFTTGGSTTDGGVDVRYQFDWDTTTSDRCTTGWVASGSDASCSYAWSDPGSYCVRARAQDTRGQWSSWSSCHRIDISNQAPSAEVPWGQQEVRKNLYLPFGTRLTDPEGDQVRFRFDWDDGSSDWSNWVSSGSFVRAEHSWSSSGSYCVDGVVEDEYGARRQVSSCESVSVTDVKDKIRYTAYIGPDSSKTAADIESYVNSMNDRPLGDVEVELVLETVVHISDPWTSYTDCSQLLQELDDPERTNDAETEVLQAFVGRDLNNNVVGCAYQDVYPADIARGIVQTVDRSDSQIVGTAGHELGHTFNAEHEYADHWDHSHWYDPDHNHCTIMWSPEDSENGDEGCEAREHWYNNGQDKSGNNAQRVINRISTNFGDNQDPRPPDVAHTNTAGTTVEIDVTAWDGDRDWVQYWVDWEDDGSWDEVSDYHPNGQTVTMSHTYGSEGSHTLRVLARDPWGGVGHDYAYTVSTNCC